MTLRSTLLSVNLSRLPSDRRIRQTDVVEGRQKRLTTTHPRPPPPPPPPPDPSNQPQASQIDPLKRKTHAILRWVGRLSIIRRKTIQPAPLSSLKGRLSSNINHGRNSHLGRSRSTKRRAVNNSPAMPVKYC